MPQEETSNASESVQQLVDATGTPWRLGVTYDQVAGRVEVARLELERQGPGRLTSTLMRSVERSVLVDLEQRRVQHEFGPAFRALQELTDEEVLGDGTDNSGPPEERQPPAMPHSRIGPRRNDELWRRRALAMAAAWRTGKPLVQALRELEPGSSESTYKQRVRRARQWDVETGAGLLTSVGRTRGPQS